MQDSGMLFLSTGRPRIYLWGLPPHADPLKDQWQPFDLGAIHNQSIQNAGGPDQEGVPEWSVVLLLFVVFFPRFPS